jgi:hypothetical protein
VLTHWCDFLSAWLLGVPDLSSSGHTEQTFSLSTEGSRSAFTPTNLNSFAEMDEIPNDDTTKINGFEKQSPPVEQKEVMSTIQICKT